MPAKYNTYNFPRKSRSCLNCARLDSPAVRICGVEMNGCRERLMGFGYAKDDARFATSYCGRWIYNPLSDKT